MKMQQDYYNLGLTSRNLFTPSAKDNLALIKWLTDLFTTSAYRATGELCNGKGGYCCLGRAFVAEGKYRFSQNEFGGYGIDDDGDTHDHEHLSDRLANEMGLRSPNGAFKGLNDTCYTSLVRLNDDAEWSFKKIAAFICGAYKSTFGVDLDLVKEYVK